MPELNNPFADSLRLDFLVVANRWQRSWQREWNDLRVIHWNSSSPYILSQCDCFMVRPFWVCHWERFFGVGVGLRVNCIYYLVLHIDLSSLWYFGVWSRFWYHYRAKPKFLFHWTHVTPRQFINVFSWNTILQLLIHRCLHSNHIDFIIKCWFYMVFLIQRAWVWRWDLN